MVTTPMVKFSEKKKCTHDNEISCLVLGFFYKRYCCDVVTIVLILTFRPFRKKNVLLNLGHAFKIKQ